MVRRAVSCTLPPGPFAVRTYVVDVAGDTDCEPLTATEPIPTIDTPVAFVVPHVRVADCPAAIADGLTVMLAVGAGAGAGVGGGGGGGGAAFLWHPARTKTVARQTATGSFFSLKWFMVNLLLSF